MGNVSFSEALEMVKKGYKASREGWNGKGMYIFLIANDGAGRMWTFTNGRNDNTNLGNFIAIKTATGEVIPWLASHADMLHNDWTISDL